MYTLIIYRNVLYHVPLATTSSHSERGGRVARKKKKGKKNRSGLIVHSLQSSRDISQSDMPTELMLPPVLLAYFVYSENPFKYWACCVLKGKPVQIICKQALGVKNTGVNQ